ncbi:MAG: protein kinase, partial [Pirellulaceae bacterium]
MNEPLQHQVNEAACQQLEKSWFAGEPVEIEVCLAGLPDEEMTGTSEELICIEMEFLWKQWSRATATSLKSTEEPVTPTSVEQYLQRFPQLGNLQHLERLVSEEINCRLQVEDRVNPAEYRQRFPELAAESSLVRSRLATLQQQHDTGQEDQTMVARSPPDQTGYGHAAVVEETLHGTPSNLQAKDAYIGKEVGGYKILTEVGRGGMGVVYKAFDTKLKRIVALKVLRNLVHSDASELDRFLGEATAAAQMDHPNIISVFEIEKDAEAPFVVLEFASGGALNDRIDGTPFAAEKAAQLILTLAEAIHAAHEKGIVHRDLKPGNVVFTANDEVKITDFGLAKWIDEASDLTKTGEMVGTPSYMAPEQVAGKSGIITARTDVYALGVILYELLTGRPPFTGSSSINTVLHVMEDDPVPPNKLQSEIGHDLNTICLKCLEKQPEKRYGTAAQLAADLQAYLEDRPITARRPSTVERSRKWIRRHPATSGFLAVATMVVLALIYTGIQVNQRLQVERDKAQDNANLATAQKIRATEAQERAENEKTQAETARNVAQQEKKRADIARGEAESNEARALHAAYVNSISLSQQDLEASNFDGADDRLLEIKTNPSMAQHRQFEMEILESVNKGAYFKLVPD